MGTMKWVGTGLKIAGQVLEKGDLDEWFLGKGVDVLAERMKGMKVPQFRGEARARASVFKDVAKAVASSAFRPALEDELGRLPDCIMWCANKLRRSAPGELRQKLYPHWAVVIPRHVVHLIFRAGVIANLRSSAVLSLFTSLPDPLLARLADRAERAFFRTLEESKGLTPVQPDAGIFGVNREFPWNDVEGHYFVVGTESRSANIKDKKRELNALQADAEPLVRMLASAVGKMDPKTLDGTKRYLQSKFGLPETPRSGPAMRAPASAGARE